MFSLWRGLLKRIMPGNLYRRFVLYSRNPPVGRVDFGDLRNTTPISRVWGLDRGRPVDRYYIEHFLAANAGDVQGEVLEIGDDTYTRRYGADKVTRSEILHVSPESPKATVVADLADAAHLPAEGFDCIICTQTLHLIYQLEGAIGTLYRLLKAGGVLLATAPGISQISRYDMDRWGDYWRLTSASAARLFGSAFSNGQVEISAYGNVLAATAFLHGLSAEELRPDELAQRDPDYQLLIAIRARKAGVQAGAP
ncbi:MAG: class I SAM-dependent methyltransferase [Candidatus Promineifilaceae bacterium]